MTALAWSPDSRRLATGSNDGTTRLWDIASQTELAVLPGQDVGNRVTSVAFSHSGRILATGSNGASQGLGRVRLWDATSGQQIAQSELTTTIQTVAFSPNDAIVAVGNANGVLFLNSTNARELVHQEQFTGEDIDGVEHLTFSPDGKMVIVGSRSGAIRFWDVISGERFPFFIEGHNDGITSVEFSPTGNNFATNSGFREGAIRLWGIPSICLATSANNVNLRAGPGTNFAQVGNLVSGQYLEVVAQTTGTDNFIWWQLDEEIWARSDVVIPIIRKGELK